MCRSRSSWSGITPARPVSSRRTSSMRKSPAVENRSAKVRVGSLKMLGFSASRMSTIFVTTAFGVNTREVFCCGT